SVCLHRSLTDPELVTDLFIQQAGGHQRHDLPFATAERRVTVPEHLDLRPLTKCSAAALDGVLYSAEQHIVVEWFGQELDGSRLHRLDCHRNIAVTRYEDDRRIRSIDNALLDVEPIEVWKGHIQYQAARNIGAWAREEFLCGREDFRLPACAADQQFQ